MSVVQAQFEAFIIAIKLLHVPSVSTESQCFNDAGKSATSKMKSIFTPLSCLATAFVP